GHLLDRALAGRVDDAHRLRRRIALADVRRNRRELRLLDVRRVAAAVARDDRVFAGLGEHLELVARGAPDRSRVGLDGAEDEAAAPEDALVGVVHVPVLALAVRAIGVEGVAVLHQELAPAHEAEARADLVPELGLDLVQVLREVAVRADLLPHDVGHGLLVRRAEAEVALVAVLDAEQLLAVALPASALLPELRRAH